ncbi:MAG: diphthine synthase [Thermoplasmata archaeon]|nr:diphthine synthase [Candidatus Sysuiplasma acidicola]
MGRLVFVGAGLGGPQSLTPQALDVLKDSACVYLETYTTLLPEDFPGQLSSMIGKRVRVVGRKEVEDGSIILESASAGKCALVVGGDAMSATTHVSLRIEAARRGIGTEMVFGQSIFTAAPSLLGLQQYRFGRTVSMPLFTERFRPSSPLEMVEANLNANLHTLLLLDIDAESNYFMAPRTCFEQLLQLSRKAGHTLLNGSTLACTVSRAGSAGSETHAGSISRLIDIDTGAPPHCVVVPSRLHFEEADALVLFSGARRDEVSGFTV